ncbi:NAD kinase [Cryomorpha ignava]|uniref:NAD kinase n=1 Tax=Cryomorpha ignava TaxID=101383 RepID=A0A7K3WKD1_9FLAO|nr:NAD kinase [Cryomorpha ignava]NEN21988.1 NAD kinase [Cryomorpha ignava]
MKIAIYGKPYKNRLNESVPHIVELIEKAGFKMAIYERYSEFLREKNILSGEYATFSRSDVNIQDYTCLVSIGGDGTLLDTVTIIDDSGVPVIGINAGRLGFISSISIDEFEDVLETLKTGNFECDNRSLLQVETARNIFGDTNFALNELTIHKKDTSSMIKIEAFLDEEILNTYWADGLIISTPTGSTAYNLSCGGPIIVPGSENVVVTPIAPHNLTVRPVVVSNHSKLRLRVSGRGDNFLITLDSRSDVIYPDEEIYVSRAPFYFRLIQPVGHGFISAMRNKLAWGLDKRN